MAVRARAARKLGALLLTEHPRPVAASEETARMLAEGIARAGFERLPWSDAVSQWLDRIRFLRRLEGEPWPDLSPETLKARAAEWLAPALFSKTSLAEISADDLARGLHAFLPRDLSRRLDQEAPTYFNAPIGRHLIDYAPEEGPVLSIRVQELFGLDRHPTVAAGRAPLMLALLSPARRPIQTTKNLPAFWRGSWAEVKREMRGRYPKHPWPDDPLAAPPTRRAKPRGK
jgi:ATP-dependent helicase HrpB